MVVCCYLQTPRHYETFPWASKKGGLELGPSRNQKPGQNSSYSLTRGGQAYILR